MQRRHLMRTIPGAGLLLAGCAWFAPTDRPLPVVFFSESSASLDSAAREVIAEAANLARRYPLQPVRVLSYVSPAGAPAANRELAEARARAVADALIAAGVPADRIRVEPRGAVSYAAMPTESRRVEIRIGT